MKKEVKYGRLVEYNTVLCRMMLFVHLVDIVERQTILHCLDFPLDKPELEEKYLKNLKSM